MAALPLSQTVDASAKKLSWRSSAMSLATSTLLQAGVIGGLVIAPLVAMQAPPIPQNVQTFQSFVPVVPPPPPPPTRVTTPRRPRVTVDPSRILDDIGRAPLDSFDDPAYDSEPIELGDVLGDFDGVPGGVDGASPAEPIVTASEPKEFPKGPIEIGNLQPPRKIHHVNPVYPRIALLSRLQGEVKMRAIIDENGNVVDLTIISSPTPLLNQASLDAVKQWRYEPTYLNGTPVPIAMTVSVVFKLNP